MAGLTAAMIQKAKRILSEQDDREEFEAQIFKPPHLARMLDICGEYTGRLDNQDRAYVVQFALDTLYSWRDLINSQNDITRLWVDALTDAAYSRARWLVAISFAGRKIGEKWVKPGQLRVKP